MQWNYLKLVRITKKLEIMAEKKSLSNAEFIGKVNSKEFNEKAGNFLRWHLCAILEKRSLLPKAMRDFVIASCIECVKAMEKE